MQKVQHNFLPLSVSHHHILNWSSNTHPKSTINYYYKSLEGYSEVSFENKCQYKGQIKNGLLHGKGIFMWPNGLIYQGQFYQSKITGNGQIRYPNGSLYRGEVANGKRCGKGVYYTTAENYTYEGDWKQGMKHGKGKISYNDKSEYTGQFFNDMRQGYGKMTYCTKNSYEGQWKNNKKQGKGTMIWLNNGQKCSNETQAQTYIQKYTGSWKQDKQDGYGEYYWYENKIQFKIFKNVYKGYWKMGKRQGFGMFLYAGGCRFQGYFVNDNKNGVGVIIDECGIAKVMNYANNKPVHVQSQAQSQPKPQKQAQQQLKLPPIQSLHSKQTSSISSHLPQPIQDTHSNKQQSISILNQSNTNEYKKYIDFNHPEINQNFYNMLLRQNTRLKNLYKNMCTLTINWNKDDRREEERAGVQENIRGYYSGLLLQGFWGVIRDSKVSDEVLSVVELDRMFYLGKRSMFAVNLPDQHIIQAYEQCKDDCGIQYEDILWLKYFKELQKVSFNWQVPKLQKSPICKLKLQAITNGKDRQIHNPQNIILFRHLICLIIRIAILQSQEQSPSSLKQRVEALITILENYVDSSIKIDKQKQKEKFKNSQPPIPFCSNTASSNFKNNVCLIGVPEWARIAHLELFNAVESPVRYIDGRVDWSMTVRKMYSILQIGGVFRDFNQKLSFLEKMEKCLNVKNSLLKKQVRNLELQKNIKQNTNMNYLLNIELTQSQCHQILFQAITKKISSIPPNSPFSPTLIQNYKKQLILIIEKIHKNYLIQISETKIKQKKLLQRVQKDWRKGSGNGIESVKDQAKKQYLLSLEELKNKEVQKMREFMKEQMEQQERNRMKMEDIDIKSGASDRFSQQQPQDDD